MNNLWNETEAKKLKKDLLKQRVYSSKLLSLNEGTVILRGVVLY